MLEQINTLDPNSLNGLKRLAGQNTPEANKAVAQQFEALFMQVVLKNMRDTVPKDGMFDSEATRSYQTMYDQQLAGVMSQQGGLGLAAAIERQLNGTSVTSVPNYDLKGPAQSGSSVPGAAGGLTLPNAIGGAGKVDGTGRTAAGGPTTGADNKAAKIPGYTPGAAAAGGAAGAGSTGSRGFVDRMWPEAQEAAQSLGVPAHFLIGQAALETGWGKSELKKADGSPSYNLFNIKAGKNWTGPVVETKTIEYVNGAAVTHTARFRAYGSYAEAFKDYASLIGSSSRYSKAVGQNDAHSFAKGLVAGGYATDPSYANKLVRVINGSSMRQGLLASAA